jgi:hypothetical protein
MKPTEPPSLATWILENMTPGERNEALAGDLLEHFRCGRPARWYWRQVLVTVTLAGHREFLKRRTVFVFAAGWSMLAPAWLLTIAGFEDRFNFIERTSRMDWPWTNICDWGLLLAANLIFIWTGIVLYLIPNLWLARNFKSQALRRGIFASIPVLMLLSTALIVLPGRFLMQHQAIARSSVTVLHPFTAAPPPHDSIQQLSPHDDGPETYGSRVLEPFNPRHAIIDIPSSAMLACLPFFLCVFCALWASTSRSNGSRKGIAA